MCFRLHFRTSPKSKSQTRFPHSLSVIPNPFTPPLFLSSLTFWLSQNSELHLWVNPQCSAFNISKLSANWVHERDGFRELGRTRLGVKRMATSSCMGLGVLSSTGSLPQSIPIIECRFRSKSAFDSFCIASEAFYDYGRRRSLTRSAAIASHE